MKKLEFTSLVFGCFAFSIALAAAFFLVIPLLSGGTRLNEGAISSNNKSVAEAVLNAESLEGLKTVCLLLARNEDTSILVNRRLGEYHQTIFEKGVVLVLLIALAFSTALFYITFKLKNLRRLAKSD